MRTLNSPPPPPPTPLPRSPDVHFVKELKHDELAESKRWADQASVVQRSFFRWLAETRDRNVRRSARHALPCLGHSARAHA